jgi:uncharacterized protein YbjT (DUF2867 family)
MRRATSTFGASSLAAVASGGALRGYWDPAGHSPECLFLDRKDLYNMYPAKKPRVTAGEYGYQRMSHWCVFVTPNPAIRMPHERRRLNPKKAEVVTVFGASGFLGSHIVRELLAHPEIKTVRVTTRYPTLITPGSELDKLLEEGGDKIELHECDVTDRIQVNVAANGADTLIFAVDYFAEYTGNSCMEVFLTGATNVAWTARQVRAERVIYCNGLDATFASESNYVDHRARGEDAVGANFPDATLLRFGPLYGGTGYRYRGLGRYFYPCVWSRSRCQPTWVVDAARAVVRCSRTQRSIRMKLDLGGPENVSHYEFVTRFAALFHPRFCFPFYKGLAMLIGRFLPWVVPNPWFDDNWLITWELDQVNRSPAMFDRLASWEKIEYKPHTMHEAALVAKGDRQLVPLHVMDKEYEDGERAEREAFFAEEKAAKERGIHRAKAEPAFGRSDGLETVANEIYPGSQFRIRPLEGAKYPEQLKHNPGPQNLL